MKVESIVRRLEPGSLWVHIAHKNNGALEIAGETVEKAMARHKVVVCTYGGSIEAKLPEEFNVLRVPSQKDWPKKVEAPVVIELGTTVVPDHKFKRRTFLVVENAHRNEALVDLDDWKTFAKNLKCPVMITWQLDSDKDPEDYDPGEADIVTMSSYDENDNFMIRKLHDTE